MSKISMPIATINPATEKNVKTFIEYADSKVNKILNDVSVSSIDWQSLRVSSRAKLIRKAGNYLKNNCEDLADLMTLEMGKPIKQAKAEIQKCSVVCEYYAKNGKKYLVDTDYPSDASNSFVQYHPLGTVLAVMPWNFPFWQVFRFAAPALVAGNTVVLKHASNVPKCALAIEKVFIKAGFPKNVFRTLLISTNKTEQLLEDARIHAVTLTGSEKAGSKIGAKAGGKLKKAVMELGGSDPFIVLPDADIKKAVETGIQARFQNTGQSCIAAKRFILDNCIADEFIERYVQKAESLNQGDPRNVDTFLGPMARNDLRDSLHKQVLASIRSGAKLLTGGKISSRTGFYYPATVLDNIKPGMKAYKEELFGPVASMIRVDHIDEAIKIANDSSFGLGSSIWSKSNKKALKYAEKIQAGATFVNEMVKSDPRLPFGGIKKSGYGRELSDFGIREFVNIKTVYVK